MINAIATAIYNILKADATLVAALGGTLANGYKCYHVIAPQKAVLPYLSFGLVTDDPMGTFASPSAIEDTYWWVNVFSSVGSKEAGTISGLVMDVLDNANLTVAGYSALKCVRDFIGSPIYDLETGVFQIPLRYQIWVDKN